MRAAVLGNMKLVEDPTDQLTARTTIFSRHPEMAEWPTGHGFAL